MDRHDWMGEYRRRLARRRIPISVTLELTRRCNLRCVHCYLGSQEAQREAAAREMDTDQVKRVIDEVVDAGCLYLLITGGDPMMRGDFGEIYRHARERGLILAVFCEGMLIDDSIVELFRVYPPQTVEISLYGSTEETYEKVTRVKGSFARCLDGVQRLLDAGIHVALKTVLMTVNAHELDAMRAMAADLDVLFRMDSAIFPCMPTGDQTPLDLRVDPELGVAKEFADGGAEESWRKYVADRIDLPPSEGLYACGAGVTGLSIDPFGWASPCLLATHVRANLLERGLDAVWNGDLKQLQERTPRADYACSSCEMRAACSACPAFNYLEMGEEDVRSDYACATAAARWHRLTGKNIGGLSAANPVAVDGE